MPRVLFKPGQSGNPGGRKKAPITIVEMCKANAPDIIQRLIDMALGKMPAVDYNTQVKAANVILDRAYGKPSQAVDVTTNGQTMPGVFVVPERVINQPEPTMDEWLDTYKPKPPSNLN